jgi:hypothetical protein
MTDRDGWHKKPAELRLLGCKIAASKIDLGHMNEGIELWLDVL